MTPIRLIKKYKNRRLYDLEASRYITVDDLQSYVLDNIAFQVIDGATNKDITNLVLMQIFVEMESNSTQFLSSEMLRQLIILAHHPMNQSFKLMLEHMMSLKDHQDHYFHAYQSKWEKQSEQLMSQWLKIMGAGKST